MLTFTSVLQEKNFLKLPALLCEHWNIKEKAVLYLSVSESKMLLTKIKRKNSYAVEIFGSGVFLPDFLAKTWIFRVNSEILLTLQDDVVTLDRGKIIYFYSPSAKDMLMTKIARELDACKPRGMACETLIGDIASFLIFSELDDKTINCLLTIPNLLIDLAEKFSDDDEYNSFLEKKLNELVSKHALNSTEINT